MEKLTIKKIKKSHNIITHNGKFHADDVYSTALLKYINPNLKVIRVPSSQGYEVNGNIIVDIGGGRYDHHGNVKELRSNNIPYASFGKLWRDIGRDIVDEDNFNKFDKIIVQPIDYTDNFGGTNPLSVMVSSFNALWDEGETSDECFNNAVYFALFTLKRYFKRVFTKRTAKDTILNLYNQSENHEYLVTDEFIPAINFLADTLAKFYIYPSDRGGYCIQGVPCSQNTNKIKVNFPASWLGRSGKSLYKVSGIKGLKFCHSANYIAVCNTKEVAINTVKSLLVKNGI